MLINMAFSGGRIVQGEHQANYIFGLDGDNILVVLLLNIPTELMC